MGDTPEPPTGPDGPTDAVHGAMQYDELGLPITPRDPVELGTPLPPPLGSELGLPRSDHPKRDIPWRLLAVAVGAVVLAVLLVGPLQRLFADHSQVSAIKKVDQRIHQSLIAYDLESARRLSCGSVLTALNGYTVVNAGIPHYEAKPGVDSKVVSSLQQATATYSSVEVSGDQAVAFGALSKVTNSTGGSEKLNVERRFSKIDGQWRLCESTVLEGDNH